MATGVIYLGPAPAGEDCAQFGTPGYREAAWAECKRYIAQIRRTLGPEPGTSRLKVKWNQHDMGEYAEVILEFDASEGVSQKYAMECELRLPEEWDDLK